MSAFPEGRENCPLRYLLSNVGGHFPHRGRPLIALRTAIAELLESKIAQIAEFNSVQDPATPDSQQISVTLTIGDWRLLRKQLRDIIEALPLEHLSEADFRRVLREELRRL